MNAALTPLEAADVIAEIAKASKLWEAVPSGPRALEALRTAEAALRGQEDERDELCRQLAEAQALLADAAETIADWGLRANSYLMVKHDLIGDVMRFSALDRTALDAAIAEAVAPYKADAERLDWLAQQFVVVRIPLRYGSQECFMGSPIDDDGESIPWGIRSAIDAARGAKS